jgi:hypothetical protein
MAAHMTHFIKASILPTAGSGPVAGGRLILTPIFKSIQYLLLFSIEFIFYTTRSDANCGNIQK